MPAASFFLLFFFAAVSEGVCEPDPSMPVVVPSLPLTTTALAGAQDRSHACYDIKRLEEMTKAKFTAVAVTIFQVRDGLVSVVLPLLLGRRGVLLQVLTRERVELVHDIQVG